MNKIALMMLAMAGLMMSCDFDKMSREREAARLAMDSLRTELITHQRMTESMLEIGSMLDSIDASRNALRTGVLEGAPYQTYTARLQEINRHVKATGQKVAALEKELKKTKKGQVTAYKAALNKLRAELDMRNKELIALQEQIGVYKSENEQLTSTVGQQRTELDERIEQLKVKQLELQALDEQVKHLLTQSKVDQAESYYLRAIAMEETAKRTHFAPRKKKATRQEALELYRLALFNGKTEAQTKIDELQRKL